MGERGSSSGGPPRARRASSWSGMDGHVVGASLAIAGSILQVCTMQAVLHDFFVPVTAYLGYTLVVSVVAIEDL